MLHLNWCLYSFCSHCPLHICCQYITKTSGVNTTFFLMNGLVCVTLMLVLFDVNMDWFFFFSKMVVTHFSPSTPRTQKTIVIKIKCNKSGINRPVNSAVRPAWFVKLYSGVKQDEREDGNDVNVEPGAGRAGARERERRREFVQLLQHHSQQRVSAARSPASTHAAD